MKRSSYPIYLQVEMPTNFLIADIDSSFTPVTPSRSETRLQAIVKALSRYIRTECDGLDPLLEAPGLKTITHTSNLGQIFEVAHCSVSSADLIDVLRQILILLLMAAISGPRREIYVMAITRLKPGVQSEIANIIQKVWPKMNIFIHGDADKIQKQQQAESASTNSSNGKQDVTLPSNDDFELEFEVRYSSLIAQKRNLEQEKDRLKKQLADMTSRLERLQDNNDLLQQRLTAAEDGLSGAARDEDSAEVIKSLESKIREQDELIANQEGQVEQDRGEKSRMRRELDRLQAASDTVIQLQDEIKELKFQNVELQKKANTVDRYKQKLESQRSLETDIKNLELENEELKMRIRDFELLKVRNESLEATHLQFQNTLSRHEMEIFELTSRKNTIDEEKKELQRALQRLEEIRLADEEHINELQEQVTARPSSLELTGAISMGNLEEELEQTAQTGTKTSLEVSRLRAENQLLKGHPSVAQEAAELRIKLEEADRIRRREEAKYNDLYEKHVIATQQVTAILTASTSEGLVKGVNAAMLFGQLTMLTPEYYRSEAFTNLRKQYLTTAEKQTAAETRANELEAQLEEIKRELLTARTDRKAHPFPFEKHMLTNVLVSMVEKEDLDALAELKETQETLASSYRTELKQLQSRYKDLEVDHEQQKSQLIQVLLSKDKLQQSVAELQTLDNSKEIKDAMEKARNDFDESLQVSRENSRLYGHSHSQFVEMVIEEWEKQLPFPQVQGSSSDREVLPTRTSKAKERASIEMIQELSLLGNERPKVSTKTPTGFVDFPLPLPVAHMGNDRSVREAGDSHPFHDVPLDLGKRIPALKPRASAWGKWFIGKSSSHPKTPPLPERLRNIGFSFSSPRDKG
jgi:hypothetical protein